MRGKSRAALGIGLGLCAGAALYGTFRVFAPVQLAFATALIGSSAGLGARLGGSFGTPQQLRVIIFGSLIAFVGAEALIYRRDPSPQENFLGYLTHDPTWLAFSLIFLVCGIILGVRLLVGNDPVGDVLEHVADTASGTGSPCPRCASRQTVRDQHSHSLTCSSCGHTWRAASQ